MINKKIATLTFHRAVNYGAVFQTYALQKAIEKEGFETEVADYRNAFLESLHNPHDLSKYKTILHYIKAITKNRVKRDNRANFESFRRAHISISQNVYDEKNISRIAEDYAAVIVGSDQVWNLNCTNQDEAYFLPFSTGTAKKFSYAASMGIKLETDELKATYRRLTEGFDAISVREVQAQQELESIGVPSVVCVDPTLLLDGCEWASLEKKPQGLSGNEKYLLVYVIVETPTIFEKAKKIAEEKGLELVYINEGLLKKGGFRNLYKLSPEEWLWAFRHASYIVTNSFHGTAFSLNFARNFVVEPLPVKSNANSRITDLLDCVGLRSHFIEGDSNIFLEDVDYSSVDLSVIKKQSQQYLKDILGTVEQQGN